MARSLPPLSALRAFEAAARHVSFKRGAAELAVTPTAISHQIRTLEQHLGLALFERRTRKVLLTEAGAELYPVLRHGFDAFDEAVARLAARRGRGQVTLTSTTAFAARWLIPRVAAFTSLHPGIDLQLQASDDALDLGRGGIDIAIRYGRGPYPDFESEVLFADRFAVVANPLLRVRRTSDLARVPRVTFRWRRAHPDNPTWERWFEAAGIAPPPRPAHLRFSEESHAIQAAVAGQGVALVSLALVADEMQSGRLVQPFGPTVPGHTYHLLTRRDVRSTSVTAAVDWLRSEVIPRGSTPA